MPAPRAPRAPHGYLQAIDPPQDIPIIPTLPEQQGRPASHSMVARASSCSCIRFAKADSFAIANSMQVSAHPGVAVAGKIGMCQVIAFDRFHRASNCWRVLRNRGDGVRLGIHEEIRAGEALPADASVATIQIDGLMVPMAGKNAGKQGSGAVEWREASSGSQIRAVRFTPSRIGIQDFSTSLALRGKLVRTLTSTITYHFLGFRGATRPRERLHRGPNR